jgi:hypothetical protein
VSGLSKEPASGRRPVLSVPLAVWSECRRGLDRARIHARWVAIAFSGVTLVLGASIVILRTLPLGPSVAVVAGGGAVAFHLSQMLALRGRQEKAVAVLRARLRTVLSISPAIRDVVHLVEDGGTIVGQFRLTTSGDDAAVLVRSHDLDTADYRTHFGPIGNWPF